MVRSFLPSVNRFAMSRLSRSMSSAYFSKNFSFISTLSPHLRRTLSRKLSFCLSIVLATAVVMTLPQRAELFPNAGRTHSRRRSRLQRKPWLRRADGRECIVSQTPGNRAVSSRLSTPGRCCKSPAPACRSLWSQKFALHRDRETHNAICSRFSESNRLRAICGHRLQRHYSPVLAPPGCRRVERLADTDFPPHASRFRAAAQSSKRLLECQSA